MPAARVGSSTENRFYGPAFRCSWTPAADRRFGIGSSAFGIGISGLSMGLSVIVKAGRTV